ncbi:MAG: tetratricopeptide repeat protein [Candidatus Moraniibacteriota bacterium]
MFYLSFILPPVIIVLSLALIIFLISRKALEIEREVIIGEKKDKESRLKMEVKSRWLHFLEKMAHWFKIFSLRLHNWVEKRLVFIKNQKNEIESDMDKREAEKNKEKINYFNEDLPIAGEKREEKIVFPEKEEKKNSMDVVKGGRINRIRRIFARKEEPVLMQEKEKDDFPAFKAERVMISEEATYPEEKKEELENILVERIAADPRDIEAYERLGDYYVSQGNKSDAEACYKQVLKLNPQSLSVRNKLSRFKRQRF